MKQNNWSAFAINGALALLFGILALAVPGTTILVFAKYFGLVMLIGGIIFLILALNNRKNHKPFTTLLIESVTGIVVGLIILFYTKESLTLFVILIGLWAIVMGVMQLVLAFQLKGDKTDRNLMIISGLVSLALGVIVFNNPWNSAEFVITLVGIIAILAGAFLLYFAFKLKSLEK